MCEECFTKNIKSFPAFWDFDAFQIELNAKINKKQLIKLDTSKFQVEKSMLANNMYSCQNCNEIWFFSCPENAWRGYFLAQGSYKKWKKHPITISSVLLFMFLLICIFLFIRNNYFK